MTLNIKQIVTLGLGIGVVVAFGYRSLLDPTPPTTSWDANFAPLDLAEAPVQQPAMTTPSVVLDTTRSDAFVGHPVSQPSAQLELAAEMQVPLPSASLQEDARRPAAEPSGETERRPAPPQVAIDQEELRLTIPESLPPAETQLVAATAADEGSQTAVQAATTEALPVAETLNSLARAPRLPGWHDNPFVTDAALAPAQESPTAKPVTKPRKPEAAPQPALPALEAGQTNPAPAPKSARASQIPEQAPRQEVRQVAAEMAPRKLSLEPTAARRAVHHIEYGKALSRRGAGYSARQEFLAALKVIVDANDQRSADGSHNQSLRRAMQIIDESNDFAVGSPEQQIQLNVAEVVGGHRCQVLTTDQAATMTSVEAMSHYLVAAQRQLDQAGGRNVVAAEIFYCLGKLHSILPEGATSVSPLETAKSVLFHQAALASNPRHHQSANELGVLFARSGRLEDSKRFFERSLMVQPTPQTWRNLSQVHLRLGETDLAKRAENEYRLSSQQQPTAGAATIQWKATQQFNAEAPAEFQLRGAPESKSATGATPAAQSSLGDRLKDLF